MRLNDMLGIQFPIIQGGMANIATGEFAAAVSNAGALGLIGAGGMNADMLRDHIRRFAARGQHMARLRPVTCWYIKGLPSAAAWRDRAMACRDEGDFLALVDDIERACREHGVEE